MMWFFIITSVRTGSGLPNLFRPTPPIRYIKTWYRSPRLTGIPLFLNGSRLTRICDGDTGRKSRPYACIEAREVVEKWGVLNDWHYAVGTGPFILQDFVPGKTATLCGTLILGARRALSGE